MRKMIVLALCIAPLLVACSSSSQQEREERAGYKVIASVSERVVTHYPTLGIVCFESGSSSPNIGNSTAFNCWGEESAPEGIRKLIK